MRETDNLPSLLTRVLGGRDKLADMIPEIPTPVENALPAVANRDLSNPDQSLQRTSERSAADEAGNLPDDSNESTATPNNEVAEEDDSSRSYRSHGSALPR
jgi:hypothetical protein